MLIKETYKHELKRPASTMKTDHWMQKQTQSKTEHEHGEHQFHMFTTERSWAQVNWYRWSGK